MAYPAMLRFLPAGFLGLMVAGLLAAYVSTISTQLNWGTSYLVHDFYRRFLRPGREERHYVMMGRLVTALLMLVAAGITFVLENARSSFDLMLSVGAGTGLIYLLRWFWWRINAWSEIAAMASSFVVTLAFFVARKAGAGVAPHIALLATVGITTVVWIAATYLTRPTEIGVLRRFYELTRPAGPGWSKIRRECGLPPSPDSLPNAFLAWVVGCTFVYSALFGFGSFLYGQTAPLMVWAAVALVSGLWLARLLPGMLGVRATSG
jgi:Na+/proline symporter